MKTSLFYEECFNKADEFGQNFNDKNKMSPLGQSLFDMMNNNNKIWMAQLELERASKK